MWDGESNIPFAIGLPNRRWIHGDDRKPEVLFGPYPTANSLAWPVDAKVGNICNLIPDLIEEA